MLSIERMLEIAKENGIEYEVGRSGKHTILNENGEKVEFSLTKSSYHFVSSIKAKDFDRSLIFNYERYESTYEEKCHGNLESKTAIAA